MMRGPVILTSVLWLSLAAAALAHSACAPWERHTIGTGNGGDGARLFDADGDGDLDISVGFEQGGVSKIFFNPGPSGADSLWPNATAWGTVPSVEDAVMADIDLDGNADVVSATEGNNRGLWIAFGPWANNNTSPKQIGLQTIPSAPPSHMYMFSVVTDLNGDGRPEIITGGKGGAQLGYFTSLSGNLRDKSNWTYYPLRKMGWTMGLVLHDMDGDGDLDLVASDRNIWNDPKGILPSVDGRGIFWLENPGAAAVLASPATAWVEHHIGMANTPAMFFGLGDIDGDGIVDVAGTSLNDNSPHLFFGGNAGGTSFTAVTPTVAGLAAAAGTDGKAATVADLDNDGQMEVVLVTDAANGTRQGVVMLRHLGDARNPNGWTWEPIAGDPGTKFDVAPVLDVDGDGDLDIVTTEETENLGVIWYENPLVP